MVEQLGRRIGDFDGASTIRYYYDGTRIIEERNGSDQRLRYHVNGAQFVESIT